MSKGSGLARIGGQRWAEQAYTLSAWVITCTLGVALTHRFGRGCPFLLLTGWNCPGCGATRAGAALLHAHLGAALHCNAAAVLLAALAPLLMLRLLRSPGAFGSSLQRRWVVISLAVTWAVVRNLPGCAALRVGVG